jgi:hypothetical protein
MYLPVFKTILNMSHMQEALQKKILCVQWDLQYADFGSQVWWKWNLVTF